MVVSSLGSEVAGALPWGVFEPISICATVAFADKGEHCPIFVKGLTQFKCVLDSAVNRPVPLIRMGYYNRPSPAGVSELYIM